MIPTAPRVVPPKPASCMKAIRILALGNVLIGDDAVGPYLLAALHAHYHFPADVDLVDAGTPGFDLLPMIEDVHTLLLLDSVTGPGPPGSISVSNRDEIIGSSLPHRRGPHDPSLRAVLLEAQMRGIGPQRVYLIGVVPESTHAGTQLTPVVRAAVPAAEAVVVQQLKNLGINPQPKTPPEQVCAWWEEINPQNA